MEKIISPLIDEEKYLSYYAYGKNGDKFLDYLKALDMTHKIIKDELPEIFDKVYTKETEDGFIFLDLSRVSVSPRIEGENYFNGEIFLLIDEGVYSAADNLAYLCKARGFATLVGRTTGGDGTGIAPMEVKLSNSGLLFRFSPTTGLNLDGTSNVEIGTSPDIACDKNEDPLYKCLEIIEEKRKKSQN